MSSVVLEGDARQRRYGAVFQAFLKLTCVSFSSIGKPLSPVLVLLALALPRLMSLFYITNGER